MVENPAMPMQPSPRRRATLVTVCLGLLGLSAVAWVYWLYAREREWDIHDPNRPVPRAVTPGTFSTEERPGQAPSDAVILFGGSEADLANWESADPENAEASFKTWTVSNGALVTGKKYLRTKQSFGDCQLHVEWMAPTPPQGTSQERGNSGVFLMGKYEVQILDTFENKTYADGYPAAIYGQYPPLVNPSLPPGKWQSYEIVFRRPRFSADGKLEKPARLTVLHNGVVVQDAQELMGPTAFRKRPPYEKHADRLPLSLQDHGNPVRFRNVWVRDLETP
jgi:hypothetical protein